MRLPVGRNIRVLLYHRILPAGAAPGEGSKGVTADRFREHLHLLDRWGFTPITFQDYQLITDGALTAPRKPIILTFDDGYEDTYSIAVPILQEFGMKAVMFVLGGSGVVRNAWDDGLGIPSAGLMSERNILELHALGFEIGSHSLTHPRLPLLDKGDAWNEISQSRIRLEIMLNAEVRTFAYPYGLVNDTLKAMVRAAGYRFACSAWTGPQHFTGDPFEIKRIEVSPDGGPGEFALKVMGPYTIYHALRQKAKTAVRRAAPAPHVRQARTLLLVSSGLGWPERQEFARREAQDERPRILPLLETLNADILDERYLRAAPRRRSLLYRATGVWLAQILEAFRVRKRYSVILSWAEHLGLPLAGLFRVTGASTPHVSIFSWISKPKKARILSLVHHSIDRIILMSSAQRDIAVNTLGIPASKIALLRWPVDQRFWRSSGCPPEMICSVGREMRDYATLLRALDGLEIPCHIAAGGQLAVGKEDPWISAISDSPSLPPGVTVGGLNFADLRKLYDRSMFVVIPLLETDTDNGTTSILEAMAMGKAVICSRVRGQVDVIRDGVNGMLVPPGDVSALREAIRSLWADPARAEAMGKHGRQFIEEHHSFDNWVRDVYRVIDEVLRARGSRQLSTYGQGRAQEGPVPQEKEVAWLHEAR